MIARIDPSTDTAINSSLPQSHSNSRDGASEKKNSGHPTDFCLSSILTFGLNILAAGPCPGIIESGGGGGGGGASNMPVSSYAERSLDEKQTTNRLHRSILQNHLFKEFCIQNNVRDRVSCLIIKREDMKFKGL